MSELLRDRFGRVIEYVRISVTDRCNLRCLYCVPASGGCWWKPAEQILRYEEIVTIATQLAQLGVRKLRVTGGEPLVRRDVVELVRALVRIPGIEEVALSTNGTLLAQHAAALKVAGLARVNISLDTLDAATFARVTRAAGLDVVLEGIQAAVRAGLSPVKINCVLLRGINDHEMERFALLAMAQPLHVRFIELMPLGNPEFFQSDRFFSIDEAKARCETWGELIPVETLAGNGPATAYRYRNGAGTVGFIGALSHGFCHRCNRLRLTSDGWLRPCLDSRTGVNLRDPLRAGASVEQLQELIRRAVEMKPEAHRMTLAMRQDEYETMCAVGG
jgi:cyclic pyranopterin phosphate synthase